MGGFELFAGELIGASGCEDLVRTAIDGVELVEAIDALDLSGDALASLAIDEVAEARPEDGFCGVEVACFDAQLLVSEGLIRLASRIPDAGVEEAIGDAVLELVDFEVSEDDAGHVAE